MIDDGDLPELLELECNSEPTEVTAEVVENAPRGQATGPEAENTVEVDSEASKNPVQQADPVDQFHRELQALAKPPKQAVKSKVRIKCDDNAVLSMRTSTKELLKQLDVERPKK